MLTLTRGNRRWGGDGTYSARWVAFATTNDEESDVDVKYDTNRRGSGTSSAVRLWAQR